MDIKFVLSKNEKIFLISQFMSKYPQVQIQDLYKWLFLGEFGIEEKNTFLKPKKNITQLQEILDDIDTEKELNIEPPCVWIPLGCSHRFVMVYVTPFFKKEFPLMRLVNILERSKAFTGSRMQFKLDWGILKEYALSVRKEWSKQDFYLFEDKIDFHSIPDVDFSETFLEAHPYKYRVVSQKLFFEYYPEFYDESELFPIKNSPKIG